MDLIYLSLGLWWYYRVYQAGCQHLIPLQYPVHLNPFFIQISNQCEHFSNLADWSAFTAAAVCVVAGQRLEFTQLPASTHTSDIK